MTDRPTEQSVTAPADAMHPRGSSARGAAMMLAVVGLAAVLAVAAWFRLSSLGGIPVHYADESYYGLQSSRLARGESFRTHTTSGNIINPFLILMQAPLHWAFEPSVWVLRLPVALSGLASVAVLFAAARRLDRRTAILAAVFLATMPRAIAFSRIGCEFGQTPLIGAIAAWFALRGRGRGLLITLLAGHLVHPTNILLAPIFLPVFLVALRVRHAEDPAGWRRALRRWSILAGLAVAGVAMAMLRRPWLRTILLERFGRWSWSEIPIHLDLTAMFPLYGAIPGLDDVTFRRWFWGTTLAVAVPAVALMIRARRWDRLALVAGAMLGLASLYVLGGAAVLGATDRYGSVLLVPGALAAACLITALLPAPAPGAASGGMGASPIALSAILGSGLLVTTFINYFAPAANSPESIWSFRAESPDIYRRALDLIRGDIARSGSPGGRPRLIIAQDYFVATPLSYLAGGRGDVVVAELITIPELGELVIGHDPLAAERPRLAERLAAGDYGVSGHSIFPQLGSFIGEVARDSFPADRLRRWPVSEPMNLTVYRVEPPPDGEQVARGGSPPDRGDIAR